MQVFSLPWSFAKRVIKWSVSIREGILAEYEESKTERCLAQTRGVGTSFTPELRPKDCKKIAVCRCAGFAVGKCPTSRPFDATKAKIEAERRRAHSSMAEQARSKEPKWNRKEERAGDLTGPECPTRENESQREREGVLWAV